MKQLSTYIILFFSIHFLYGQQGVFVDGASVYIQPNTNFYVDGDVEIMPAGTIENNGSIEMTDNWINNSGGTGLINDAPGKVNLVGGTQFLMGDNVTHFYTLNLLGGFSNKEAFQDQIVTNKLNLANAELQVHQTIFHLTNPAPDSLQWVNGYISGDSIGGYFARSTNRIRAYRFPVGSGSLFNSQYRAVDISPTKTDSSVFGVRLAAEDASNDQTGISFTGADGPYSRLAKQPELLELNPVFYHHVVRLDGTSPANARIYYFESDNLSQDRRFDGLSNWDNGLDQWTFEDALFAANISGPSDVGGPNSSLSWLLDNSGDDPYILTRLEGILVFVPQIFSPNGDGFNDVLFVRGRKIKSVEMVIYNRWGEKVFQTNDKNIGWDGKHRGKDAQSSVYVYYVKADVEDVGIVEEKGNVTLVR